MGAFSAKRVTNTRMQLPLLDTPSNIRRRLSMLSSSNDPVYRAAFNEYITNDDIRDSLKSSEMMTQMTSSNLAVFRGDVYVDRYMIVEKVGSGRYTSVWLAVDLNTYTTRRNPTCEYVVIKISREEVHYSRGIRLEIELRSRILEALESARIPRGYSPPIRIFGHFKLTGLNSSHICLIMERMRCDLRALMNLSESHRLPIHTVRLIARDALKALHFLHFQCGLVHTDLRPSNILIAVDEALLASGRYRDPVNDSTYDVEELRRPPPVIKIGDLGSATDVAAPRVMSAIGNIHYRAPEVLLGIHCSLCYFKAVQFLKSCKLRCLVVRLYNFRDVNWDEAFQSRTRSITKL